MIGYRNDYFDKDGKHVRASFHPFLTRAKECYERQENRHLLHVRLPGAREAADAERAAGLHVETTRVRLRVTGDALFLALNRSAAHGDPERNKK